jgi:hypothetical protein
MTTLSPPAREAPWRAGLRSARANLLPGLALQAFALTLVLLYYFWPPATQQLNDLAAWRIEVGLISSIFSTALFGGLIPWLYLRLNPATQSRYDPRQGLALTLFWGYKGIEIDLLFRFQAAAVGTGNDPLTVFIKACVDQLLYNPLLAAPGMWLAYAFIEARFRARPVWERLRRPGWYMTQLLPLMIANFGVWAPAVVLIYLLPTSLQLPLQNLVLCFFTLMVAHLAQTRPDAQAG